MKDFILNILYWLLVVIVFIVAIPIVIVVMALAIITCVILLPFALVAEAFEPR